MFKRMMKFLFGEGFPIFTGGATATGTAIVKWGELGEIALAASVGTFVGILIKNVLWDMLLKKRIAKMVTNAEKRRIKRHAQTK